MKLPCRDRVGTATPQCMRALRLVSEGLSTAQTKTPPQWAGFGCAGWDCSAAVFVVTAAQTKGALPVAQIQEHGFPGGTIDAVVIGHDVQTAICRHGNTFEFFRCPD